MYYFTATVPEYDRIELRSSPTLAGLPRAVPQVVWTKHPGGIMSSHIWAPELHRLEDKWYLYFAAGTVDAEWNIHKYVLENTSENPLEGTWVEKGRIATGNSTFTLDATVFTHGGRHYLVWAQKPAERPKVSNLYIAALANPWTIEGEPVLLSEPDHDWEQHLFHVNEGPTVIEREGRLFLTYSASGTDYHYCMGLLTASVGTDLLDRRSWTKSPVPVFQSSESHGIWGPGHSCFTTTEDGRQDLLVYHARDYREIAGDPLDDPNRHCRVQKFFWDTQGNPVFGEPVANTASGANG
jgi:GH43 family beta-xylosidase